MYYRHLQTFRNNWQTALLNARLQNSTTENNEIQLYYEIQLENVEPLILKLNYNKADLIKDYIQPYKMTIRSTTHNAPIYLDIHSENYWPGDIVNGNEVDSHDIYPFFCKRNYFIIKELLETICTKHECV